MSDFNLQSLAILFQDETVYRLKSDFETIAQELPIEIVQVEVDSKSQTDLQKVEYQTVVDKTEKVEALKTTPQNIKLKVNLIMVSAQLSPEIEGFLQKIMNAIGYKSEQYVVVNTFADLFKYEFEFLILFGMRHKSLNFKPYQITPFNSYKCLLADNLEAIEKDKSMKTLLWKNLQEMFGV